MILVAHKPAIKRVQNTLNRIFLRKTSIEEAKEEIMRYISQTRNLKMEEREKLPKLQPTKMKRKAIKLSNAALKLILDVK